MPVRSYMQPQITLSIEHTDALAIDGDVLASKYADGFYGVGAAIAQKLAQQGIDIESQMPQPGSFRIFETCSAINSPQVIFINVGFLYDFQYKEIREFSRLVLESLTQSNTQTSRLIMTLHGVGYGLDEIEVLESEIAGLMDAIAAGNYPRGLKSIVFAERNLSRARRLKAALDKLLTSGEILIPGLSSFNTFGHHVSNRLRNVGYESGSKAHVFVAMPFAEEMDDVYHYGIQGAVKAAGFLCERADLSSFTGDVMNWVKQRIESATLVIADLTGANANVYLEVGYAWGCKRPTILLIRDSKDLKFDVRGQRCLKYKKIKELEALLQQELEQLKQSDPDSTSMR